MTTDKAVLIIGVTVAIIILAYFLRLGRFSRRKKQGDDRGKP
jgi:beta-lactamase regulating signal transducer with metallopeptidase domain